MKIDSYQDMLDVIREISGFAHRLSLRGIVMDIRRM